MKKFIKIMRKLKENKNGRVVTFDFDNTIVKSFENDNDGMHIDYQPGGINKEIIKRIKKFKQAGVTVFVVTSRSSHKEVPESSVDTLLKNLNIEVDGIFYTNEKPKAEKLYELGSSLHYDDDPKEHEAIKAYSHLHSNFNITVKYPDELLSDTDEVSKGLIMTEDDQLIIVQRSDSHEWDAAGGHLMDGEKPAFAFWREIKEEMDLEVKKIQYLDSRVTQWKGKNKKVHYFLGSVPYTALEIHGSVILQWELSDYFVGSLEEIKDKMETPDGATENLKNAVDLLATDDFLLTEKNKFLSKSEEGHYTMKKRLVGTDGRPQGRQTTGADGLKKMKDYKKAKSAPPGAAGGGWSPSLEEESETKPKKKIRIRIKSGLVEKKGKKGKKRKNKYHWNVSSWWYGGGYSDGGKNGGNTR